MRWRREGDDQADALRRRRSDQLSEMFAGRLKTDSLQRQNSFSQENILDTFLVQAIQEKVDSSSE
jgi:DNA primase catalytic subunit